MAIMRKKTGMSSELSLEQLEYLASPEAREFLEMELPKDPLAAQKTLRKKVSSTFALAIGVLRVVRKKALDKFPQEMAQKILGSNTMIQQASSMMVAKYKAAAVSERFDVKELVDICTGLGVDAIASGLAGIETKSYDASPEAVYCAKYNAELFNLTNCHFETADAAAIDIPADAIVHVDPDRRATGRRSVHLKDYSPAEEFLVELTAKTAGGVMKLSPALPREELEVFGDIDVEYVSTNNVCRQLLLWWPGQGNVKATVVRDDSTAESIVAADELADVREDFGRFVIEPDHAVLAASATDALAIKLGAWKLADQLVWLFSDSPADTPLARSFEIISHVPGRVSDVVKELRKNDAGQVELKTRGVQLNTDALQKKFSGKGSERLTVLWCRVGHKQHAFICKRFLK